MSVPRHLDDFDDPDYEADAEMEMMLDLVGSKCSICFTADSEVDLLSCGDQFCCQCIETYWIGKLKESAWGLFHAPLDCPVCRLPVSSNENWEQVSGIIERLIVLVGFG